MQIRLNGEAQILKEEITVEALLETFRLDARKVAVELNRAIVPRSLYGETSLQEGDQIEIVKFIGGG
jgi:thiamine biosynthesis protein ThiS